MRVNHLSNIKRHRHEVALKSSAKIKETSVDKSNRKSASLDTDESWCICGLTRIWWNDCLWKDTMPSRVMPPVVHEDHNGTKWKSKWLCSRHSVGNTGLIKSYNSSNCNFPSYTEKMRHISVLCCCCPAEEVAVCFSLLSQVWLGTFLPLRKGR